MTINDILLFSALPILLVLTVPFCSTRKFVLELSALALRLAIVGLLAGGAFLWFRPDMMPDVVVRTINSMPPLRDILPSSEAPTFGLAVACLAAAVLVPFLAVFDVSRKLAGARLRRFRAMTNPLPAASMRPAPAVVVPTPAPRLPSRRAAADVMARAGSRTARG